MPIQRVRRRSAGWRSRKRASETTHAINPTAHTNHMRVKTSCRIGNHVMRSTIERRSYDGLRVTDICQL